jgi:hypothetical protein
VDIIPGIGMEPPVANPVPAVATPLGGPRLPLVPVRLLGVPGLPPVLVLLKLVQGDKLPGAGNAIIPPRPIVLSAVAPSGTFPPVKASAVPKEDVSPSGPAPAEGAAPQPESVGSTEDAISLAEVDIVPLVANIEPVPSVPTPGIGPAPGQVGLAIAASVGAGLRPPAKSSVVPSGIPAPPIDASVVIAPTGDRAAT